MKNNIIKKNSFQSLFAIVISGFMLVSSCKENTILPPDLVPPVDNINTFLDTTIKVVSHNMYQDSILTGGVNTSVRVSNVSNFYYALGSLTNDNNFGKTNASFHVDIVPPNTSFTFKDSNIVFDSVVIAIPFVSSYGDTNTATPQTFNVYRSIKRSSRDSAQYEFTKDVYDPTILGSKTVNFNTFKTDSPLVGTVKVIPQLRIKLPLWIGDSVLAQTKITNGATATFDNFLNWWNGFYIAPADTNVGNTIGYFNTYGSRLYFYTRNTNTSGGQDTITNIFGFSAENCNRFNTINRNYTGSVSANYLNTTSIDGDSIIFMQSAPGLATILSFPTIGNIENCIVNKAELVFSSLVPTSSMTDSLLHGILPRLQVFKVDEYGNDKVVPDYVDIGTSYVNGYRTSYSLFGMTYVQYKLVLTESFQKAISQKDTTFRLKIFGPNIGFPGIYQSVLKGSGSVDVALKPRLNLIYTKLK